MKTGARAAEPADLARIRPLDVGGPFSNGHGALPVEVAGDEAPALDDMSSHDPSTSREGVLDHEQALALAAADDRHWWFRSKAHFVAGLARATGVRPGRYVDLGGGSAGVTARLAPTLGQPVVAEGSVELLSVARRRYRMPAIAAVIGELPVRSTTIDVVTLLDVIEHLPEPSATLAEARRMLRPDGALVVTVPAHPRLWSRADELLGHHRRYTRRTLRAELTSAGFSVERITHVFSWLVLPVWLRRRYAPSPEAQLGLDQQSRLVDFAARVLTAIESAVARRVSLPFGTTIVCVARRLDPVDPSHEG